LGRNSSVSTQRMNEISLINEVLIGDRNEHLSFRTGVWGSSPAGRAITHFKFQCSSFQDVFV
jgi:hypothetical protein